MEVTGAAFDGCKDCAHCFLVMALGTSLETHRRSSRRDAR